MDLLRATADSLDPSPNGPSSKTDGQSPNPPLAHDNQSNLRVGAELRRVDDQLMISGEGLREPNNRASIARYEAD